MGLFIISVDTILSLTPQIFGIMMNQSKEYAQHQASDNLLAHLGCTAAIIMNSHIFLSQVTE